MSEKIKPLDVVRTPKGAIALVTETDGNRTSIDFFPHQEHFFEKNAWWHTEDLRVLGSIPAMLANASAHPFGSNTKQGDLFFGRGK